MSKKRKSTAEKNVKTLLSLEKQTENELLKQHIVPLRVIFQLLAKYYNNTNEVAALHTIEGELGGATSKDLEKKITELKNVLRNPPEHYQSSESNEQSLGAAGMSRRNFLKKAAVATVATAIVPNQVLKAATQEPVPIPNGVSFMEKSFSPKNATRPARKSTQLIVLHTTLDSDRNKNVSNVNTSSFNSVYAQGSCNYFVNTDGEICRVIDKNKMGRHAGYSMWNGQTELSFHSIGIEIAAFENTDPLKYPDQVKAVKYLIESLRKEVYPGSNLTDDQVLPHCMIAYGPPNDWHPKNYRPRRKCAMLYSDKRVRAALGLNSLPSKDPDVVAGRLVVSTDPDFEKLFKYLYREISAPPVIRRDGGILTEGKTPYSLVAEYYADEKTFYTYPDGTVKTGAQIEKEKQWSNLPENTVIAYDKPAEPHLTKEQKGLQEKFHRRPEFKEKGKDGKNAFSLVKGEYDEKTTIYFFPDKRVFRADQLSRREINHLEDGTKVVTGYMDGGKIKNDRSPYRICGKKWNLPSTIYVVEGGDLLFGDELSERNIPMDASIYYVIGDLF